MKQLVTIILLIGIYSSSAGRFKLQDKHLLYYEPLHYDTNDLHIQHESYSSPENTLIIRFHAYNRNFTLQLKRLSPSPKMVVRHKGENRVSDLSFMYTGTDQEYPESDVRISVFNGTFHGQIKHVGETTYHVVPSWSFFTGSPPFHTVIYSEKDYNRTLVFHPESPIGEDNYQKDDGGKNSASKSRFSRSIPVDEDTILKKRVCPLKVTTDILVWKYFMEQTQNEDRAFFEILSLIQDHVTETNEILSSTQFNVNGNDVTGVRLALKKTEIYQYEDCEYNEKVSDEYYDPLCDKDVTDYNHVLAGFDAYEAYDYDAPGSDYCLSMLVTARLLYKSAMIPILGFTNAAKPGDDFGICSNHNTGYITLFQHETERAMSVHLSQLVFAHEVAHAFGAYHDNNVQHCSDYTLNTEPADGYFLMHSVVSGESKPNNRKLSECSRHRIAKILGSSKSTECFIGGDLPFCGNGIVEDGEECDCGDACHMDMCCHSPNATVSTLRCKLKQGAECSPSKGPCCDSHTCKPINSTENFVCQNRQECVDTIYCKGERYGAVCPEPEWRQVRDDNTTCGVNGKVCDQGSCTRSVCTLIHWTECSVNVDSKTLTLEDKETMCYMGCENPVTQECISTNDMDKVKQHPELQHLLYNISQHNPSIKLSIGTPCNKNMGYCDVFGRCRGADPDTPLVKLKKCFTGGQCLKYIAEFVEKNWWAVLLVSVGAIIMFLLAVKCLAVHTKSSNKVLEEKHPRRSFRQSSVILRNDMSTLQRSLRNSFRRRTPINSLSGEHELQQNEGISEQQMTLLNEKNAEEDDVFTT